MWLCDCCAGHGSKVWLPSRSINMETHYKGKMSGEDIDRLIKITVDIHRCFFVSRAYAQALRRGVMRYLIGARSVWARVSSWWGICDISQQVHKLPALDTDFLWIHLYPRPVLTPRMQLIRHACIWLMIIIGNEKSICCMSTEIITLKYLDSSDSFQRRIMTIWHTDIGISLVIKFSGLSW